MNRNPGSCFRGGRQRSAAGPGNPGDMMGTQRFRRTLHTKETAMVPVYVINLERRADRRRRVGERLAHAGITPTWIEAVDAAALADVPPGTLVTKPHFACWLSHIRFLETFLDSAASCGVVFEDDAVPSPAVRWPRILEQLPQVMANLRLGYLQLGHVTYFGRRKSLLRRGVQSLRHAARRFRGRAESAAVRLDGKIRTVHMGTSRPGTHGYAVSREFAEQVRHLNKPSWLHADGFYSQLAPALRHEATFKMGTLVPSLVDQETRIAGCRTIDSDIG